MINKEKNKRLNYILFLVAGILIGIVLSINFTKEEDPIAYENPTIEELSPSIESAILESERNCYDVIIEKLNERHPGLSFTLENGSEIEEGYYLFSGEENNHYEITIYFNPTVEEYEQVLIPYTTAVNGLLSYVKEEEGVFDLSALNIGRETGRIEINEESSFLLENANATYFRTNNDSYKEILKNEVASLFSINTNTASWTFNLRWEKLEKEIIHYYKSKEVLDPSTKETAIEYTEVSEAEDYDKKVSETYYVDKLMGDITIPLTCNLSGYRIEELQSLKEELTTAESKISDAEELVTLNDNQASKLVYGTVLSYFGENDSTWISEITLSGHTGTVTSSGWDYSAYSNKDLSSSKEFWTYSRSLRDTLAEYPYAINDNQGYLPDDYTCAIFAATFFYDVYGFSALRGDGAFMADNLLTDCGAGKENACPIKFMESDSVSPGAIISFYPNHVACVVSVNEDGSFVIADGNIVPYHYIRTGKTYSSLEEYCYENGSSVKNIVIPLN